VPRAPPRRPRAGDRAAPRGAAATALEQVVAHPDPEARAIAAASPEAGPALLSRLMRDPAARVRWAVAENKKTPPSVRAEHEAYREHPALRAGLAALTPDEARASGVTLLGDSHLGDFMEHKAVVSPPDAVISMNLAEQTRKVLATLRPRETRVLRLRVGIGEESDHTLEEVGQDFEVTRERIRAIEARALKKLRHPSRSKRPKAFVES
jgi:RNA polymerase sigma factor (sigma-70 family)